MVLPERRVDLPGLEKALDMPCSIFHSMKYGHPGDLGIAGDDFPLLFRSGIVNGFGKSHHGLHHNRAGLHHNGKSSAPSPR